MYEEARECLLKRGVEPSPAALFEWCEGIAHSRLITEGVTCALFFDVLRIGEEVERGR